MRQHEVARRLLIPGGDLQLYRRLRVPFALPLIAGPMRIQVSSATLPFLHVTAVDPVRNRIVRKTGNCVEGIAPAMLLSGCEKGTRPERRERRGETSHRAL
jgi:hypothetical protein